MRLRPRGSGACPRPPPPRHGRRWIFSRYAKHVCKCAGYQFPGFTALLRRVAAHVSAHPKPHQSQTLVRLGLEHAAQGVAPRCGQRSNTEHWRAKHDTWRKNDCPWKRMAYSQIHQSPVPAHVIGESRLRFQFRRLSRRSFTARSLLWEQASGSVSPATSVRTGPRHGGFLATRLVP